eukprot:12291778-Karenia_brevis.AAC.1
MRAFRLPHNPQQTCCVVLLRCQTCNVALEIDRDKMKHNTAVDFPAPIGPWTSRKRDPQAAIAAEAGHRAHNCALSVRKPKYNM